jgi:hypothetical protein
MAKTTAVPSWPYFAAAFLNSVGVILPSVFLSKNVKLQGKRGASLQPNKLN